MTKATGLTDSSLPPQKRQSGKTDLVVDKRPIGNIRTSKDCWTIFLCQRRHTRAVDFLDFRFFLILMNPVHFFCCKLQCNRADDK